MLIYFFIPIILYSFKKIIIMTIFICFSLYVREMFCFKQISSHFSVADVCFLGLRRFFCVCQWYHFSVIINPISAPAPRPSHPTLPSTAMGTVRGMEGGSGNLIGPHGHALANDSTMMFWVSQLTRRTRHSFPRNNSTLFSTLKTKPNKYFCNENVIYCW